MSDVAFTKIVDVDTVTSIDDDDYIFVAQDGDIKKIQKSNSDFGGGGGIFKIDSLADDYGSDEFAANFVEALLGGAMIYIRTGSAVSGNWSGEQYSPVLNWSVSTHSGVTTYTLYFCTFTSVSSVNYSVIEISV